MIRPRVYLMRALLALAVVVGIDVILSLSLQGRVGKRPLPPFGIELDAPQLAILSRLEAGELNPNTVTAFDRDLGWCVRPGAVAADGTIHINARGQRGLRDYSESPEPGRLRLACFGDSFTFCDEVKDEFTFEAFLERLAPSVEALNYGVPAYGTDQALLRMRRQGIDHAQVVVIGLLLENIGRNVNRYRPLWTPRTQVPLAKPRFILEGEKLKLVQQPFESGRDFALALRAGTALGALSRHEYWRDRPSVPTGRLSSLVRLGAGWLAYRERDPRRLWLERDGEPRRITLALLQAFHREALALGAKGILVLMLPMKEELEDYRQSGIAYWSDALKDLRALGIDCIDLAPELAAAALRCEQDPKQGSLYVSAHLSSVGNQVIAIAIERWLTKEKLLTPVGANRR